MIQLLKLALRNLFGYPLRTLLTTLGVVFGVGSVIAMMAMGAGAEQAILKEIGRLGIQNVILNSVKPPEKKKAEASNRGFRVSEYGLKFKDEKQIRATLPGLKRVLPVHKRPRQDAWFGSRKVEVTVHAVRAEQMRLLGLRVARGRNLCDLDEARLQRVCVVRSGLLKELGIFRDPIGMPLQVENGFYRIVGILKDEEFLGYAAKALGVDAKTFEVYVPYETVLRREGTRTTISKSGQFESTDVQLSQIIVSVDNLDDVVLTGRMLRRLLDKNHEDQDYELVVPLEVLAQRRETKRVFTYAMIAIASISLLVGGIGIANIMLATVTERTREIGVRRALGAKRRHIVSQFLMETTVISTLGGVIGIGVGFGMIRALSALADWPGIVRPASIVLALGIAMATGILFGLFPARRAAMLDPIAALRHE
jgi:putative ABC transport system permease protein